jgi:hypothetical protein
LAIQLAFFYGLKNYYGPDGYAINKDKKSMLDFGMAAVYSAFLQNVIMSILFFYATKNANKSHSVSLGAMKLIGTLFPSILFGFIYGIEYIVIACGAICLIFDSLYIYRMVILKQYF